MKTTRSKDGTQIAYDIYGRGPALIYVTGAICFREFGPVVKDAKVFAEHFTVYCYDRRGRGGSTDTAPYSIAKEVEDLEAMIDASGGSAVVYGHSSGASLALEAALSIPQKISKVLLYDTANAANEKEKTEYAKLIDQVNARIDNKDNAGALKKFLLGIGMPKPFVFLIPLMPGWKKMKNLAPTLKYDMILTKDLPPVERASQLKIPITIMVGQKSPSSMHRVAELLRSAIPHADVVEVAGQDHMVNPKIILKQLTSP